MMMKPYFFAFGDIILTQDSYNDNVMLVLEGTVQARVMKEGWDGRQQEDFWFDTLEIGACFNVYNSFSEKKSSLLTYVASSEDCQIGMINVAQLMELAQNNANLQYALKTVQLRIKHDLVDDLDVFTFPMKFLEFRNQDLSDKEIRQQRRDFVMAKRGMQSHLLRYVRDLRLGKKNFPKVLYLLDTIRQDRLVNQKHSNRLEQMQIEHLRDSFDIHGIYVKFLGERAKQFIYNNHQRTCTRGDQSLTTFRSSQSSIRRSLI